MNLTISPIVFTKQKYIAKEKSVKHDDYSSSAYFDASFAPKNQITFGRSIQAKRELVRKTIKENEIPISPQTLEFILFPSLGAKKSEKYIKYTKTGSKFFELYSRYLLHKTHPLKDEGELTNIIALFIKNKNKARIINEMLPMGLKATSDKDAVQNRQARCLNALLGAIIYENEDGFRTAFNFMEGKIGKNIFPQNMLFKDNLFETLLKCIEEQGKSWDDICCETKLYNDQWHCTIYYKDMIIAQAQDDKHAHVAQNACIDEAIRRLESKEVQLDCAKDDLDYMNYKIPDKERTEKLKDFCQKWGLDFNNINLLQKAFIYGTMPDGSALAHCDTYETLEYIGDAALGFCTHEIIQDNMENPKREEINVKRHAFVKNKNLSLLAKRMNLESYTINRDQKRGEKRMADMFEALIGAIFLDGGEDGLDNVYRFLDENFREDILSQ